jgi:glutathione S-transferase
MITLYVFGPFFGLPDASPFVIKAMLLLKFAGLKYAVNARGFSRAPKGKLPYIDDNGTIVDDSTFIRFHIEKTRGVDFDAKLSAVERAQSWAIEKLCEDHLRWIGVRARWMNDANFERGLSIMFNRLPLTARSVAKWVFRRKMARTLWFQGIGRLSEEEVATLGRRDIDALSTLLADKPYLFGDSPCAADAALFAFIAMTLENVTLSPTRDAALAKPNLVAYRDRILSAYFPEVETAARRANRQ